MSLLAFVVNHKGLFCRVRSRFKPILILNFTKIPISPHHCVEFQVMWLVGCCRQHRANPTMVVSQLRKHESTQPLRKKSRRWRKGFPYGRRRNRVCNIKVPPGYPTCNNHFLKVTARTRVEGVMRRTLCVKRDGWCLKRGSRNERVRYVDPRAFGMGITD